MIKTTVCGKEVTLPADNPRDVFEYIKNHLLTQNKQCYGIVDNEEMGYEGCLYRSEDRTAACAAGSLIPDLEYSEYMENKPITQLGCIRKQYPNTIGVIQNLQVIHDYCDVSVWKQRLESYYEEMIN